MTVDSQSATSSEDEDGPGATPRLLFVGDNRDVRNWGSRASSLALGQLLADVGQITSVERSRCITPTPVGPLFGLLHHHRYGKKALSRMRIPKHHRVQRTFVALGNHIDYVGYDPRQSLARFMRKLSSDSGLAWLFHQFRSADAVVINGEGTLVLREPAPRDLHFQLFAIQLARELGKPVCYINSIASDCSDCPTNVTAEAAVSASLSECAVVSARDSVSQRRLQRIGLNDVAMTPDALFVWGRRYARFFASAAIHETPELVDSWPESDHFLHGSSTLPEEYICVSGASWHLHQDLKEWSAFFESLVLQVQRRTGLPVVLFDSGGDRPSGGDKFLMDVARRTDTVLVRPTTNVLVACYVLANARAVVSGRFHPSIMASLGGAPCTLLECCTHKTLSLQEQLEYPQPQVFPIDNSPTNVADIVDDVTTKLAQGELLRERLRGTSLSLGEEAGRGIAQAISTLVREGPG